MDEEILNIAKKDISDPDLIVDLFDLSVLWMSKRLMKLTGYSEPDTGNINLIDLFGYEEERSRKMISKDFKEHGKRKLIAKTKDGKRFELTAEYFNFEYKKGFYRVAKVLSHDEPGSS